MVFIRSTRKGSNSRPIAWRPRVCASWLQFWGSWARLRGRKEELGDVSRIGFCFLAAFLLQVMVSQSRVMYLLFETTPMTANQWLACFGLATPMLLVALFANRWPVNWVPPQRTVPGAG